MVSITQHTSLAYSPAQFRLLVRTVHPPSPCSAACICVHGRGGRGSRAATPFQACNDQHVVLVVSDVKEGNVGGEEKLRTVYGYKRREERVLLKESKREMGAERPAVRSLSS